jgi:hypothetical protein
VEYDLQRPHPDALRNFGMAHVPESKVRYPLRDPDKSKAFEALGFSEGAGNWEALRGEIVGNLPLYAACFSHRDEWGITYDVDMPVAGVEGRKAPVRTKWIYRSGEDFPRLVTLYVKTTEWRRWEREESS